MQNCFTDLLLLLFSVDSIDGKDLTRLEEMIRCMFLLSVISH